jgi:hypothetical protein
MTYISLIGLESQQQTRVVRAICLSIWFVMRPECIPKRTKEQWKLIALEFERRPNFPHRLRAVDGKYIRVIRPEHSGSLFHNYRYFVHSTKVCGMRFCNFEQ